MKELGGPHAGRNSIIGGLPLRRLSYGHPSAGSLWPMGYPEALPQQSIAHGKVIDKDLFRL